MAVKRVKVVCTGAGGHGEILFARLEVDGETITEVRSRRGRSPLQGDGMGIEDGREVPISVGARMIVAVPSAKQPNGTWRFTCPSCRRDRPLTEANLRRWIAVGTAALDISMLPR